MAKTDKGQIELLCQISKADSLQKIADLCYHLLGNPVFISDMAHTMLAYTQCINIPHPSWQTNVVNAHLDRNVLKQDREVGIVHGASTENKMPVLVDDDNVPFPRYIKTLMVDGKAMGVLVLTAYLRPFGDSDAGLLELVSTYIVQLFRTGSIHLSGSGNVVENYLIQLLDGKAHTAAHVAKRLAVLGWNHLKYCYVLAITIQNDQDTKGDIASLLRALSPLPNSACFLYNNALIYLYTGEEEVFRWETQAAPLFKLLERYRLVAGVSRHFFGLEQIYQYYKQAAYAVHTGRTLERAHRFFTYDSLSVYHMFQELPDANPHRFCHQKVRQLNDYDREKGTAFCQTLQVYLENTRSLSKTAEILYIHRNTVRYRIQKCMELLGSDLTDGNETFPYILSLRIIEYEKKMC